MKTISDYVLRFRKVIIISTIFITFVLGYFIKDLYINPDVFDSLPRDDKVAILFNKVGEEYGGNYYCIIGIQSEDIFRKEVFEHIRQITDSLRFMNGVGSIMSLIDVIDIKGSDWGIEIGKLVDEYDLPDTEKEWNDLRSYVLSKEMYKGTLVSADATLTIIMVRLQGEVEKIEVARNLRRKTMELGLPEKLYFGGQPFFVEAIGNVISKDLTLIGPFSFLLILFVLYFSFRSIRGVILPVLTILISIIWTYGVMGLTGVEISIITSIIPILLIAIGSAYTIHVYNRIEETVAKNKDSGLKVALAYIMIPVFFASLTTIFGFLSFIFGSYIKIISTFGVFTSLGIFFAMLLSLFFTPALIATFPARKSKLSRRSSGSFLILLLDKLHRYINKYPKTIVIVWAFIIIPFLFGIFRIERKVDFLDYLKKDNPNRITEKVLTEKMGGTSPVYVSVKGDVLDLEVLKQIKATSDFMLKDKNLVNARSVADLFEQMNDVMGEGKKIPDDPEKVANLWFLLEGQEILEQLVSPELDEAMINATFGSTDIQDIKIFIDGLNQYILEKGDIKIEVTGIPSLVLKLDRSIITSQMRSLGIATILVFIAVSFLMRSFFKGTITIIPIIVTLVILYGFMGLSGIPLDIATVLVGSISIGIGIDYSIHMITNLNHEMKYSGKLAEAIKNSIKISGKSIIINVMAVSFGFLILLWSNLIPLQRFGLLVSITMITSGLGSLTLLPAILILIERSKLLLFIKPIKK